MRTKIAGINCEVVTNEEIAASGCPQVAMPLAEALRYAEGQSLDEAYMAGTKAGYHCTICGQECILAPSGQAIQALGKNPLICLKCANRMAAA